MCLLADILKDLLNVEVEQLNETFGNIQLVDETKPATGEQVKELKEYMNLKVSSQDQFNWYCLLREAQGNLGAWINNGLKYMIDSQNFLKDGLFCEYAYIVNLDDNVLEVYTGRRSLEAKGRYSNEQYGDYTLHLVMTIPLSEISRFTISDSDDVNPFCEWVESLIGNVYNINFDDFFKEMSEFEA